MGRIHDASLASSGEKSYQWAAAHMPTLKRTIDRFGEDKPLSGHKLVVCLHVTKETSVLIRGFQHLGAEVYLSGANPLSTQDDIAAYLAANGVEVWAWRGQNAQEYTECIKSTLTSEPDIVVDDGADLHAMIHDGENYSNLKIIGGNEETTTGVVRLMAMEKSGVLRYPVLAINNAQTKFLFDNRYGTGQSVFDGILRSTSLLIAGKTVVVSGYGWVGKGIAKRARGLDAHLVVTEVDPFKAIEAHMDGFEVLPMADAAKKGDIFITATGQTSVISGKDLEQMKDGAIIANAGHFDLETDVKYLNNVSVLKEGVRPHVDEHQMQNGRKIYLIAKGRIANLVAAEGHPPEVMALSFSNQLLGAVHIAQNHQTLERKVYDVPEAIDRQVAKNALEAMNIRIDSPTDEQIKYADSWTL